MQKVIRFLEKNELEIRISFYLIIINTGWIYFIVELFSGSNFNDNVFNYSLWIPSVIFVIYLIIKKFNSGEFLFFVPVRFALFYVFFHSLLFNIAYLSHNMILNRQKYNELETFIVYTFDDNEERTITFVEKIYNKIFK